MLFKRVVDIAKKLDTKYIRVFSFYNNSDEWSADKRDEVVARLKRMIEYAKSEGIILLHENEKDIYGDTIERCLYLMEHLYCDSFKTVFDPANFVQCAQDTKEVFDMLRSYIEYIHINDALSDGTVVPSGRGIGNINYILKNLFHSGYDGYLSIETHLGSFYGLSSLEKYSKTERLHKSGEETFKLAFDYLNTIIDEII